MDDKLKESANSLIKLVDKMFRQNFGKAKNSKIEQTYTELLKELSYEKLSATACVLSNDVNDIFKVVHLLFDMANQLSPSKDAMHLYEVSSTALDLLVKTRYDNKTPPQALLDLKNAALFMKEKLELYDAKLEFNAVKINEDIKIFELIYSADDYNAEKYKILNFMELVKNSAGKKSTKKFNAALEETFNAQSTEYKAALKSVENLQEEAQNIFYMRTEYYGSYFLSSMFLKPLFQCVNSKYSTKETKVKIETGELLTCLYKHTFSIEHLFESSLAPAFFLLSSYVLPKYSILGAASMQVAYSLAFEDGLKYAIPSVTCNFLLNMMIDDYPNGRVVPGLLTPIFGEMVQLLYNLVNYELLGENSHTVVNYELLGENSYTCNDSQAC